MPKFDYEPELAIDKRKEDSKKQSSQTNKKNRLNQIKANKILKDNKMDNLPNMLSSDEDITLQLDKHEDTKFKKNTLPEK